ncbi:hypothetical protein PS925_03733 [Pseudomonas fluorescens]|uniref:Delta-60 repeat protein n=1 Tax=Pseudomonas fluorescens TaxID=294 RepID=A0A5E7UPR9_PSEFL|nr:hypothetical protein [Pseudomonas fluorescens]VVQ13191.1 hypothetical protein PS925_03733 [Pseudomonas fluorescens]
MTPSNAALPIDTTFGNQGYTDSFALGSQALSIAGLRPDGKIFLVGQTFVQGKASFHLAQLLANGKNDTDFGDNGLTVGTFTGSGQASGSGACLYKDGKALLFGYQYDEGEGTRFALARFLIDGKRDAIFGTVYIPFLPQPESQPSKPGAFADSSSRTRVVLTADEKILVGQSNRLFRLDQKGIFDTTFNGKGWLDIAPNISSISVAENGVITVAGTTAASRNGVIVRLNVNGTPDEDFGDDGTGTVYLPSDYPTSVRSLMLRADGSFFVAGEVDTAPNDVWGKGRRGMMAAYNPDGKPNIAFNQGKPIVTDLGLTDGCSWFDLSGEPKDGLVVVGGTGQRTREQMLACRYLATGELDTTFGEGKGYVTHYLGPGMQWISVAVQPDKRILLSRASDNINLGALVVRYQG